MTDAIKALVEKVRNEPVVVTTLVGAVLALLVAFKVPVTDEQAAAVIGVVTAILAFFVRGKVVPKKKLK